MQLKNQLTHFKSETQIRHWFEQLGIADKIDARVGQMSFGQQQRVAALRALVQPFDFLLADEPISHLDDVMPKYLENLWPTRLNNKGQRLLLQVLVSIHTCYTIKR